MATLSPKKVIVRLLDQSTLAGYLPAVGLLGPSGNIDLLDPSGRVSALALSEVRYIAYVRDFNLDDHQNPERLTRRSFLARPRTEGLWLRLTFRAGDVLEGLAPLDLALLDDAIADRGLYLTPPDIRSNTQRLFVPRAALSSLLVVAVITTPSKATAVTPAKPRHADEPGLPFPDLP